MALWCCGYETKLLSVAIWQHLSLNKDLYFLGKEKTRIEDLTAQVVCANRTLIKIIKGENKTRTIEGHWTFTCPHGRLVPASCQVKVKVTNLTQNLK